MEDAWKEGGRWFCSPSCLMQGSSGTWKQKPRHKWGRRLAWTVGILVLLLGGLIALGATLGTKSAAHNHGGKAASSTATPTVHSIRAEINLIRRHAHLKPLRLDQAASLLAAAHSKSMAQTGRLVSVPNKDIDPFLHSGRKGDVYQVVVSFSGQPLRSAGQVVGYMMRAHHGRARTRGSLNPNHNRVGIGIARRPSSLWATAIFITAPKSG